MREIIGKKGEVVVSSLSDQAVADILERIGNGDSSTFASSLHESWYQRKEFKGGQLYWAHKLALDWCADVIERLKTYKLKDNNEPQLGIRELVVLGRERPDFSVSAIQTVSGISDQTAKELLWWDNVLTVKDAVQWAYEMAQKNKKPQS